jgi:hypothetical protein
MGRQRGLVHLTGQYGDVQLSISADGVPIAKFAPPTSGKKVKTAANYVLTRKNNDEFTGAGHSAKSLRICLGERLKQFSDRHLTARAMALTRSVISQGPGAGGKRTFEVVPHADVFRQLEVDKREQLNGRFYARYTVSTNPDRNTATVDIDSFVPQNFIHPPSGARYYRLVLVAGVLSDFEYTGDAFVYSPINPLLNELTTTVDSGALLPIDNLPTGPLQLVASISGTPILPSSAGLVVSLGIEFYRVINGFEDLFASGNALQVVGVF